MHRLPTNVSTLSLLPWKFIYEEVDTLEIMAFGSITSYQQLHLFNFSSTSDHFEFPLLLEQIAPPPSLQPLLSKLHAAWQFLPYLAPYVPLLSNFPSLTIFDNISSTLTLLLYLLHLVDLSFLFPYCPTHCLNGFHRCLKVLKIPLCGTLLPSRSFQGTSPSFDMLIFGYISTTNIKKRGNYPHSPLSYCPGILQAHFQHLLTSCSVPSIRFPPLKASYHHSALTYLSLTRLRTLMWNITVSF